jgi:hypothetical protein
MSAEILANKYMDGYLSTIKYGGVGGEGDSSYPQGTKISLAVAAIAIVTIAMGVGYIRWKK